jgi:hypothetical protein
MFDLLTVDLLFTLAASFSLLILWAASAAILPWTEAELDQVQDDLRVIAGHLVPSKPEIRRVA